MKETINRGVVVKITEKDIVMMCDNGTFKNIPRESSGQPPMLGQRFSYTEKQRPNYNMFKYISIASVLLLTLLAYSFVPFGLKGNAYIIAMDINPSIEIILDKNMKVQDIVGVNSDGEKMIESLEVKNQHIFAVLEIIISTASHKGYLQSHEEDLVSITVISLDEKLRPNVESNLIIDDIQKEIGRSLINNSIKSNVSVSQGSKEMYQEAKELDLSVNQFIVYRELYLQGIVRVPAEVRDKTIFQLRKMGEEKLEQNLEKREDKLPIVERPNIDRPDVGRPDVDLDRSDVDKPGVERPDVDRPDVDRPNVKRPDAERPNQERQR